ncbi:MAG: helix-turn-helix domain-containing protein [Deltaproteobacteria bacterium]|nr:helix-turn-helix domain-containing protein [Deltaproteobacteria bacterium]
MELESIADETKITITNLKAMEEDNFDSLPPEAFARGFYSLYAKKLNLDPREILHSYSQEKSHHPAAKEQPSPPPNKLAPQVRNLARRPTTIPLSYTGLIILLLLLTGAFLSWYFSWNPASYLSEKLKAFRKPPENTQVTEPVEKPAKNVPLYEITKIKPKVQSADNPAPKQQAGKTPAVQ